MPNVNISYFSPTDTGGVAGAFTYNPGTPGTPATASYVVPGSAGTTFTLPNGQGTGGVNPNFGGFENPIVGTISGWGVPQSVSFPYNPTSGFAGTDGNILTPLDVYDLYGWYTLNGGSGDFNLVLMPYFSTAAICFKEDSEILTYDESADKESYVKVQDLRKGMLVKTLRSGYVPVKIATTSKVYNPGNSHRSENRLYRCPKSVFPELKEDLIITGHHSILVDNLTEEQVNEIQDTYGRIYITEKKYRLPAFVDERTVPYEEEGTFNIYHFALENSNVKANYGVYANGGLLVESANEWRLREKSGHKIISE